MARRGDARPVKAMSKWAVLQWLEPEITLGRTFWPEVFSAFTMLLPALHGSNLAADLASGAAFPQGVWVLLYGAIFHCPVSMAYHLSNAVLEGTAGHDVMLTPFRTADLTAIHLCCIAFGWAESYGDILYTLALTVLNLICIFALLHDLASGRRGGQHEVHRVAVAVFLYTLPVLLRGDCWNYLGIAVSWILAAAFQMISPKIGGWGHGLFHMMLVPYFHFLMHGVASAGQ
ncbi:unnamed protein product [Effrenium voratum]|uniref:Uncharacterized protein n=1 Tax=Effrenium voratum TaxID=2562239 RepID=A0AA36HPS2_9DINO|nr:unnamed protein product [Effrenium voratum]CAJ1453992.1 unnamed protein product [Effrenium voratum]|mmetsp:Transcript_5976/g.14020  ORF Transcript_5976/g.14020 Transcript_5976/m.14020 type:complete len:231 (+) Transcript_5976:40-732(+)